MIMERRKYLSAVGVAAITGLAGCFGDDSDDDDPETGSLSTAVSDDQHTAIDQFNSLVVSVDTIRVFPQEEDESNPDGETTDDENGDEASDSDPIEIDAGGAEIDLVSVQGDDFDIIDESELETGSYSHLQLHIQDEIDAMLIDGSEDVTVTTPGDAPLQFNQEFEIRTDEKTTFVADFAPFEGGGQEYQLRPVPSAIRVMYGEIPDDSTDDTNSTDSGNTTGPRSDPNTDEDNERRPSGPPDADR